MSRKDERYASAWDVIADTPEQAPHLHARAEGLQKIASIFKESGRGQTEAARRSHA